MSVTVEIPMTLPSVANGSHGHWSTRAKRVKAQRHATLMMLQVNQGRINSLGGFAGAALVVIAVGVNNQVTHLDPIAALNSAKGDPSPTLAPTATSAPVVTTVPLQIFACEIADTRGLDVDQPRNLAKSVTVE